MTMKRAVTLDQKHSIVESAHSYGLILDSREIIFHGEVDLVGELGYTFINNMRILISQSKTAPITIHQHSLGGDWSCGMMIYDCIVTSPCPIIFVCHGVAASMGSIIPLACNEHGDAYIINMPNCDWLIHDGTTDINEYLTYKQSVSWAKWEKRTRDQMLDWYANACVDSVFHKDKKRSAVKAYIKRKLGAEEDWWLSSREAVEHGFADAVLGDENFETLNDIKKHWV